MRSSLARHAVLLFLCSLFALWVWDLGGNAHDLQQIRVLRLKASDIQEIRHEWPGGLSHLHIKGSNSSRGYRLQLAQTNNSLIGEGQNEIRHFMVPPSRIVLDGLAKLTPLRAYKRLPQTDSTQVARYGFHEVERRLHISKTNGDALTLEFGQETYGGLARYMRLNKEVFLVDASIPRAFEGPPKRLTEARLIAVDIASIESVNVLMGKDHWSFHHKDRQHPQKRRFVVAGMDEQQAPQLAQLLTQLGKLFSHQYQDPPPEISTAIAELTLNTEEELIHIRLARNEEAYWLAINDWIVPLNPVAGTRLLEDIRAAMPLL